MKVGYSQDTYEEFAARFDIVIRFSEDQYLQFKEDRPVDLTSFQLDEIIEQISGEKGLGAFLEDNAPQIPPLCMSLFVLNEATWALMDRKPWDKDKMLAMTTMPYCFWDHLEKSASNPKSVKRWDITSNTLTFRRTPPTLSIAGDGGDFSGFIPQSMVTARKFGLPETWDLVPNYEFKKLEIVAEVAKASVRIHPDPINELDYDYSAPARVFYEHGIQLELSGESVTLHVEKRKSAKLRGTVHLLVGVSKDPETDLWRRLLADIWFLAFQRFVGAKS